MCCVKFIISTSSGVQLSGNYVTHGAVQPWRCRSGTFPSVQMENPYALRSHSQPLLSGYGNYQFSVFIVTPTVDLSCNCTICSPPCLNVVGWHLSRAAVVHCVCPSSLTVTGTHLWGLCHMLFIHSSIDGNLDHFHSLASGENDAMTIDV